jgi:selenide,water dikinase
MDPPPNVRLLVVLDRPTAVYSGMVPGFVAGDYAIHELEIDVVPLARRARAGVLLAAARDLDPVRREIALEGRPPIRFDLASLDVGSTVRGLELPGVPEHALATRPIGEFVRRVDARVESLARAGRSPRVLVVGGGAAGTEIAFTLEARLRAAGAPPSVTVVTSLPALLMETSSRTRRCVAREAKRRGIEVLGERRVERVEERGVLVTPLDSRGSAAGLQRLEADLVIWATGAAPVAFPADQGSSRLARDEMGFLEIRDTLQVVGHDHVFAVGDCARLVDHRWVPRAGVYAVRQGPVLERNLRAQLAGRALTRYAPQRDFLSLLNLGGGRALGSKWGLAAAGSGVLKLKDWIDRRFMERFQVLDAWGRPKPALETLGKMDSAGDAEAAAEMACGGCAAKLGALPLQSALAALPRAPEDPSVLLGLEARDDVAATRDASGRTMLHNVDVIRAFCDDPWLVGRVAASNALSDLYAKGGRARHAQAVIGLPDLEAQLSRELLFQALSGLRSILDEVGVSLLGGHTTIGDELTIGLAVTGDGPAAEALLRHDGARPGDDLLLTQPLGTGVVLAADMRGLSRGAWVTEAYRLLQHVNDVAGRIALEQGVHAATDVTGFGLAGHLISLLRRRGLGAQLEREAIPLLPGAEGLWREGLRSTAHPANRAAFAPHVMGASPTDEAWLFDPQTAGGLLLALDPKDTDRCLAAFREAGEPEVFRIGRVAAIDADKGHSTPCIEITSAPEPQTLPTHDAPDTPRARPAPAATIAAS